MATIMTNKAVHAYRRLLLNQQRLDQQEKELLGIVQRLSEEEFADYVKMTVQIDNAVNALGEDPSSQVFRAAVNRAGLDRASH